MESDLRTCSECGERNRYVARVNSGGGHGPVLLPGLGGFLSFAAFDVVVCATCGLTQFYAERSALEKLPTAKRWRRL